MNTLILSVILVPIVEIYLFIKIGAQIGAFNTILLIFLTAFVGIFYARYEGLNNFKSGFSQIIKKETPTYEIISGAAITFGCFTFNNTRICYRYNGIFNYISIH